MYVYLKNSKTLVILSFVSIVLFISGCEDLLPEYKKPDKVFEAYFTTASTHTVRYVASFNDEYTVANYTAYGNEIFDPFTVTFGVKNIFDETIQTKAVVKGSVVIFPDANPNYTETHLLTNDDLAKNSAYDPNTQTVTLNPNASVFVTTTLKFKLLDKLYMHYFAPVVSRDFINYKGALHYQIVHAPMRATARITIQLADNIPPVVAVHTFEVTLYGLIRIPGR